jgi:hypothetical protein
MREIGALIWWGWVYSELKCSSVTGDDTNCHYIRAPTQKFDATAMAAFVARGSEPTTGEAGRSGEGGIGEYPPV